MQFLTDIMLEILKFFFAIGGQNYGLAIIWLTVAVNIALYPLTLSSIQQMAAMQKIQPKMQELQKKHKDDPKKMQQELMGLYKGEGVNPLGGCLPTLLKIPFFLALFFALQSKEFLALVGQGGSGQSFLWMANIANPDPIRLMPIIIGITTWYMQKSMPAAPGQPKLMIYVMPIMIAFISVAFPAGVQIYWVVSNLMGGVQQSHIMKREGQKSEKRRVKK
jgi:YidC/Oxa1 family membrane protein insertase